MSQEVTGQVREFGKQRGILKSRSASVQTRLKQSLGDRLIGKRNGSEKGRSSGSAVGRENGPADVTVGRHGSQLPPDVVWQARLLQTVLDHSDFA